MVANIIHFVCFYPTQLIPSPTLYRCYTDVIIVIVVIAIILIIIITFRTYVLMECLLYCSVAEAVCVGVLFHEQDTWHSRQRVKSPPQRSNYECSNIHDVVLQFIYCKFFTLYASSFYSCIIVMLNVG